MEPNDLQEAGKSILDKIPDIAFDWYARLIPGFICVALVEYIYRFKLDWIKDNFILVAMAAYIIGHLAQPFSSGLLLLKWENLKEKKDSLMLKAYSELIGFFSCFLFTLGLLLFKIVDNIQKDSGFKWQDYYLVLIVSMILFAVAAYSRKIAYDRKYRNQKKEAKEADAKKDVPAFRYVIRTFGRR